MMQTRNALRTAITLCMAAILGLVNPGQSIAETVTISPQLRQLVIGWTRLTFVSGHIVNLRSWPRTVSTNMNVDGTKDEITAEGNGQTGSLRYRRSGAKQDFQLEMNSDGKFHFHWHNNGSDKGGDDKCDVELNQMPNEMLTLTVAAGGKQKSLQGNTFWNLWIADPDLCRKHVAPILQSLRPDWSVASTGASVEAELLRLAAAGQHSDRKQWTAWVEQLGDTQFMKRETADHHLRAVGPPALGFLRQINPEQLDAEQQFRLQRIVHLLTRQTDEDTPEQIAQTLIEDPLVWLALMSRQEESTRRTATNQLAMILGEKINFDPASDPEKQTAILDELSARLHRTAGSGRAKANAEADKPKETKSEDKTPHPAPAVQVK